MKPWMAKTGIFLLVLFFIFGIINYVYINADRELADVADKLIRLHVVANSDSVEDQELKRKVRDEVIRQMAPKLEAIKDLDQVKQIIEGNLDLIQKTAAKVVEDNQKDYGAKAMLGNYDFPTKTYGNLTLPAGNYQALRLVLGKGEGRLTAARTDAEVPVKLKFKLVEIVKTMNTRMAKVGQFFNFTINTKTP